MRLGPESGLDLCRLITGRVPESRVVFLSVYDDEQYVFEALRAGAGGYLLKRVDGPELVRRLEEVAQGETVVDPTLAGRMAVTAARLTRGEFWPGANRGSPSARARCCRCSSEVCRTRRSRRGWC